MSRPALTFKRPFYSSTTHLRDQYTLVYRPPNLQPDGKFHTIKLDAPQRAATFLVRSGYYAEK